MVERSIRIAKHKTKKIKIIDEARSCKVVVVWVDQNDVLSVVFHCCLGVLQ